MKKEKIDLFYGALLHDIGKVIQRATGERKKHALVGADWFDEIADNQVISDQIRYHMANYQSDKLGNDHLITLLLVSTEDSQMRRVTRMHQLRFGIPIQTRLIFLMFLELKRINAILNRRF